MAETGNAAFIGLGVMGYPMAGHLKFNGWDVTVYSRITAKAEAWLAEHGGAARPSPAEAAAEADIVFTCVGNDDDLRAVVLGGTGALAGMRNGTVLVDHTTTSATVASECQAAAKARAGNGVLTIMVGGEDAAFERARRPWSRSAVPSY